MAPSDTSYHAMQQHRSLTRLKFGGIAVGVVLVAVLLAVDSASAMPGGNGNGNAFGLNGGNGGGHGGGNGLAVGHGGGSSSNAVSTGSSGGPGNSGGGNGNGNANGHANGAGVPGGGQELAGQPLFSISPDFWTGRGNGNGQANGQGRGPNSGDTEIAALTEGLPSNGKFNGENFGNHGQRVRTMVALAKALGYKARVGAMQANFGTPQETGIFELQQAITTLEGNLVVQEGELLILQMQLTSAIMDRDLKQTDLETAQMNLDTAIAADPPTDPLVLENLTMIRDQAAMDLQTAEDLIVTTDGNIMTQDGLIETTKMTIETTETELAETIVDVKPGNGPGGEWETANLDVNNDGTVDEQDLDAL